MADPERLTKVISISLWAKCNRQVAQFQPLPDGHAGPMMLTFSALVGTADSASSGRCAHHDSQALCMVFRRQDQCTWDEAESRCVAELPCELRWPERCEYELTTGAPWDRTKNKCFLGSEGRCRWTDECLDISAHGGDSQSCVAAGCQWTKICQPVSSKLVHPGLYPQTPRCVHKCAPPGFRSGEAAQEEGHASESARAAAPASSGVSGGKVPASGGTVPASDGTVLASADGGAPMASGAPSYSYSYSYEGNGSYSYEASYSYECCDKPPAPPAPPVLVELPDGGSLSGKRLPRSEVFLGVPFAAAPLGKLRWAPPQPLSGGWSGVLEATSYSARCQPLVAAADCLGFGRGEGSCAGNSEDCAPPGSV